MRLGYLALCWFIRSNSGNFSLITKPSCIYKLWIRFLQIVCCCGERSYVFGPAGHGGMAVPTGLCSECSALFSSPYPLKRVDEHAPEYARDLLHFHRTRVDYTYSLIRARCQFCMFIYGFFYGKSVPRNTSAPLPDIIDICLSFNIQFLDFDNPVEEHARILSELAVEGEIPQMVQTLEQYQMAMYLAIWEANRFDKRTGFWTYPLLRLIPSFAKHLHLF